LNEDWEHAQKLYQSTSFYQSQLPYITGKSKGYTAYVWVFSDRSATGTGNRIFNLCKFSRGV